MKHLSLALWLSLLSSHFLWCQPLDTLFLPAAPPDTLDIRPHMQVFFDSSGTLTFAEVTAANFQPLSRSGEKFRLLDNQSLWIRFIASNTSLEELIFVQNHPNKSARSQVYKSSGRKSRQYQSGFFIPLQHAFDSMATPGHIIHLAPADTAIFYVHYQRTPLLPIPTVFRPQHYTFTNQVAYRQQKVDKLTEHLWYYNFYHVFWGIAITFLVLSLSRFVYSKDLAALWSSCFLLFSMLLAYFYYQSDSFVAVFHTPQNSIFSYYYYSLRHHTILLLNLTFTILHFFQVLFYQRFFQMRQSWPRTYRLFNVFKYSYLALLGSITLSFYLGWESAFQTISSTAYLVTFFTSIVMLIAIARIRTTLAYLIVIGSGVALFSALVGMLDGIFFSLNFMWRAVLSMSSILVLYLFYYLGLSYRSRLIEVEATQIKAAQALSDQRTRLLTNITHEFRTPITIIQGIAGQISGSANRQRQSVIQRNTHRLKLLVDQILDLRKMDAGKMEVHWRQGDLVTFVRQQVESYRPYLDSQQIQLHIRTPDTSIQMDFDPVKVQQILANLLSNAIKYMGGPGTITVTMNRLTDKQSAQFQLQVSDTGPGMSAAVQQQVFDRFFQADSSLVRPGEGTGIGLAHTRELVQLLGGRIRVDTESGRGSTFTVLLPIHQQAPLMNDSPPSLAPPTTNGSIPAPVHAASLIDQPQILLVEDNPDLLAYLSECLADRYQLLTALNGKEGLKLARQHLPDLIISDLMMPQMDGLSMLQHLKQDERANHLPVLLLTARAALSDRLKGLRFGADAYLSKPFDEQELLVQIENLIKTRTLLQQKYQQHLLTSNQQQTDKLLDQLHQLLQHRLGDSSLRIEDIAHELQLDRTQLFRKIKQLTGDSPSTYLRKIRLQHARSLLRQTDLRISDIAYQCGFGTPAAFSRAYTKYFGHPPSKEREEE